MITQIVGNFFGCVTDLFRCEVHLFQLPNDARGQEISLVGIVAIEVANQAEEGRELGDGLGRDDAITHHPELLKEGAHEQSLVWFVRFPPGRTKFAHSTLR